VGVAGRIIRLNNEDKHRACYLKPRVTDKSLGTNGNLRSQIQNIVTYYTYASLCMHQGGKMPSEEREKKEKKTPNMSMRMRKSEAFGTIFIFFNTTWSSLRERRPNPTQ
jgi:hypothetical protein